MIKPEVVNQLSAIHELQLLMHLSKVPEWKHNKVSREELADSLSIAEITVKVALRSLKNKGLIDRVRKGVYKIKQENIV